MPAFAPQDSPIGQTVRHERGFLLEPPPLMVEYVEFVDGHVGRAAWEYFGTPLIDAACAFLQFWKGLPARGDRGYRYEIDSVARDREKSEVVSGHHTLIASGLQGRRRRHGMAEVNHVTKFLLRRDGMSKVFLMRMTRECTPSIPELKQRALPEETCV